MAGASAAVDVLNTLNPRLYAISRPIKPEMMKHWEQRHTATKGKRRK
jgi:hypothetical protein